MSERLEEFDVDALEREFNETWEDSEETQDETEQIEETETDDSEELETEDDEAEVEEEEQEPEEVEEEEEEPELDRDEPFQKKPKQTKEENAAFAELRRQKEEYEKQARTLEKVAAQYEMTPEQFMEKYEQQQQEQRAQQQGIPVDVLRRMEQMESQLNETKTSAAREKFWNEVDTVKAKYDLTTQEIDKLFNYIGENGLVNLETKLPIVSFEVAYKAANFDNVIERKSKEAKQQALAAKKQRQQKSAKGHTNSNAGNQAPKEDFSLDEVEAQLRKEGLI